MPWNFVPPLPPSVAGKIEAPSFANNLSNSLEIGYSGPEPLQVKLRTVPYTISAYLPPVTTHHYAIVGEVRYENVATGTYLEMWSHFVSSIPGAPDESYFTRTLGDSGPMEKLEGTHDWRGFYLPFDSTGAKGKLTQLDFNIHFAGYGDVHLSNMRLVQYPDTSLPGQSPTAPANLVPQSVVESARTNLRVVQLQYAAGDTDQLAVLEAEQRLQWAEAMFAGDQLAAAKANRDGAKERLALMEKEYKAGVLDFTKMAPVEKELGDAEALLSELQSKQKSDLSAPSARLPVIDWKSFVLGIAATLLTITCACSFSYLAKRLNRHRHERELRRIASLDS